MQLLRMIRADFTKGLLVTIRYPVEFAASMIGVGVIYLGVYWGNRMVPVTGEADDPVLRSLVGYLMWYYLALVTGSLSTSLHHEATEGTLEQLWLTPEGPVRVLLSRLVAVLLRGTTEILVVLAVLMAFTGVLPTSTMGIALALLGISVLGLVGFGYLLAGLTLMFKRVAGVIGLFNLGMLILLGFFGVPRDGVTSILFKALPLVEGSRLIHHVLSGGSMPDLATDIVLIGVNSLLYVGAGLWCFRLAEHRTRQLGTLGQF